MQTTFRMTTQLRAATLRRSATWSSAPRRFPLTTRTIVTKRYTPEHEAIVFDDATGLGIISITDHAQASLGDVVFVELPNLGTELTRGEHLGAVESVKAASDIYAPVSGTVEAVNDALSSEPGLLNKSAEDKGWLCKIKLSDPLEMDKLMTEEAYKASYQS
ncbi:glycine cleavage H-protein-domain-containing protein [Infundibulicybe gibba]|nr:glycine cleavage H-protein-domain-containing protein [Infundibulicybe gibba]